MLFLLSMKREREKEENKANPFRMWPKYPNMRAMITGGWHRDVETFAVATHARRDRVRNQHKTACTLIQTADR